MRKVILFVVGLFVSASLPAQSSLPSVSNLASGWNTIPTDGMCSAGTPYQFYSKVSASSDKLLIFFNGGGACWFGQGCDLNSSPNVHTPFAATNINNPARAHGIFANSVADNPFADYDMVVIAYCTGDTHIGSGEKFYTYTNSEGGIVSIKTYHNGYANSSTVLNWVYENFLTPTSIVVGGSSAGAIGASFYAGFVAEHYADKPVVLIADSAGGYNSPNLAVTFNAWNTASILPDWPQYVGKSNDNLTFEDFYIASANHSPNLTIAQYNAAEDSVQKNYTYLIGDPPESFSLPQRILNHYVEIESAVDDFFTYTAGGDEHTILTSPIFYSYKVEGVRFVDWVSELINGKKVRDISCVNETGGCESAPGAKEPLNK